MYTPVISIQAFNSSERMNLHVEKKNKLSLHSVQLRLPLARWYCFTCSLTGCGQWCSTILQTVTYIWAKHEQPTMKEDCPRCFAQAHFDEHRTEKHLLYQLGFIEKCNVISNQLSLPCMPEGAWDKAKGNCCVYKTPLSFSFPYIHNFPQVQRVSTSGVLSSLCYPVVC